MLNCKPPAWRSSLEASAVCLPLNTRVRAQARSGYTTDFVNDSLTAGRAFAEVFQVGQEVRHRRRAGSFYKRAERLSALGDDNALTWFQGSSDFRHFMLKFTRADLSRFHVEQMLNILSKNARTVLAAIPKKGRSSFQDRP